MADVSVSDPGAWYRPAQVHPVEYDPAWPVLYVEEAERITAVLRGWLVRLDHVGSTAVVGMVAKPIIDVLATVASFDNFAAMSVALGSVGYVYTPESELDDPGRKVFRKGPVDMTIARTHHLHVVLDGSEYGRRLVAFRDHLRRDVVAASAYAALKRKLQVVYEFDSRGYTASKGPFIVEIDSAIVAHVKSLDAPER